MAETFKLILNNDAAAHGGSNTHVGDVTAEAIEAYGKPSSLQLDIPALSTPMVLKT